MEKYKQNTLYHIASEYKDKIISEEEILKNNLTKTFYAELEYMIANGEIIIININAKMRLGKSTQAIALGQDIHKLLQKYEHQPKNTQFTIKNIARDQQEHSKLMRNPNIKQTIIVTDESNELENTGENVTIEHAMSRVFSDVQAGRYVHRICCSPKANVDANADILLQITSINKNTKTTHNKLYYKFYEGGIEYTQLIGYVEINVGKLIDTWESRAKKIFFKHNPTKKEQETLKKIAREDLYTQYQIKKFEKMELLTREGILRPRMLDTASITLTVVNELKELTRVMRITPEIIRSLIKEQVRINKIPMSIVGEELAVKDVRGIIGTYQELHAITTKLKKLYVEYKQGKIDADEYEYDTKQLKNAQNKLARIATKQCEELEHYQKVNNKYNQHIKEQEQ